MIGNIYKLDDELELVVVSQRKDYAVCAPLLRNAEPSSPEELKVLQGTVAVWFRMKLLITTLRKLHCVDELDDTDKFATKVLYMISLHGYDYLWIPPAIQVGPEDGVHADSRTYQRKFKAALER